MRILVTGLIGQYPIGGVTWDYFQYVLGFHRLGHEVYYLEDTGQWPYQPVENGLTKDPSYTTQYIHDLMKRFGLGNRWAYCYPHDSQWFGLTEARRKEVVETCDVLLNVSGTVERPNQYRGRGRLVYLDSDPVFTQVKLAAGQEYFRKLVDAHDVQFSFGERMGVEVPDTGHDWRPTRQPIVLDEWTPSREHGDDFTTVMSWKSYNPIEYDGKTYGQKDLEFMKFVDLPALTAPAQFAIAANKGKKGAPEALLRHKGWTLLDPIEISRDIDSYRDFIRNSKAEWSVAKNGYVQGQSGWFSCRSACYLAAARPVIVQDTGFSKLLPTGRGLLAFTTLDEAVAAVREVQNDYPRHSAAALEIAREYFDSDIVLSRLLEDALRR